MSSLVSLYLVRTGDLPALVDAAGSDRCRDALHRLGKEVAEEYGWSGQVMLNVLDSLDAANVPLEGPALRAASEAINRDHDYTTLIASDAKAFLDRLDPAAHRPADLLDGPIELGLDDEEAGYAVEETLSLLRDTIAGLSDDEVLVLHIG